MIRVYVDAVADLLHIGHLNFFRMAKSVPTIKTQLIVGVHSDKTAAGYKRKPVIDQYQRYEMVRALEIVDEVIEDAPLILTPRYLYDNRIDMVVRADDVKVTNPQIEQVVSFVTFVPYTKGISTSQIIEEIRNG